MFTTTAQKIPYEQGYEAFRKGVEFLDNPYVKSCPHRELKWNTGWLKSRIDYYNEILSQDKTTL
jgi:hypothetical protein